MRIYIAILYGFRFAVFIFFRRVQSSTKSEINENKRKIKRLKTFLFRYFFSVQVQLFAFCERKNPFFFFAFKWHRQLSLNIDIIKVWLLFLIPCYFVCLLFLLICCCFVSFFWLSSLCVAFIEAIQAFIWSFKLSTKSSTKLNLKHTNDIRCYSVSI